MYSAFLRYVDIFNLNVTWILSAGCLIESNFYHSLLVSTMGTLAIAGFVLVSHAVSRRRCPAHDREACVKIDQRHASVLFWISLLVYATVSSSIFHTFACDDLDNGSSFLRSDHSLECYTTTHKIFMAYAGVMVAVFPLGIPLCYAFVLYRNRASLKVGISLGASTANVASFRELWEPYRSQVYFYEVVECLRRVLLSGVVVFIFPNTAGQVATSLLLAIFTAAVFMALDPYVSRWHTWLARISHAVVILSLYVALLQKVDDVNDDMSSQHVFACVLVATNCGLIVAVGVEAYGMFSVAISEIRKPTVHISGNNIGTFRLSSSDSSGRVVPLTESPPNNEMCMELEMG